MNSGMQTNYIFYPFLKLNRMMTIKATNYTYVIANLIKTLEIEIY